jgi:hypothetical protein
MLTKKIRSSTSANEDPHDRSRHAVSINNHQRTIQDLVDRIKDMGLEIAALQRARRNTNAELRRNFNLVIEDAPIASSSETSTVLTPSPPHALSDYGRRMNEAPGRGGGRKAMDAEVRE